MSSAVQICSNAMLMLGQKPINSLAEDPTQATSDRELAAANLYPQVRNAVLRAHPWNCATRRVTLTPDSTPPAFSWSYQFLKPGDWLRTLQVGEDGCPEKFLDEGGRLLCNTNVLNLVYIWRNENPATWDSMLIDAMSAAMAARMALTLTGDLEKKNSAEAAYKLLMQQTRTVDGQDEPPLDFNDSPLLLARF